MTGWQCPQCSKVWAPWVQECLACNGKGVSNRETERSSYPFSFPCLARGGYITEGIMGPIVINRYGECEDDGR